MRLQKVLIATTVSLLIATASPAAAGAAGPKISPSSNLARGAGTYSSFISASKGAFPRVPGAASSDWTGATITGVAGSTKITSAAGTFSSTSIGSFVDDGIGGTVSDGVSVGGMSALIAVYPRQGLSKIKAVSLDGV
ncbi:MAG: hypothetical protein JHC94_03975, partial [Acidimicrobiia bacterium]|nr:hypothetical protein [Acidimicrobiia bacterium]